MPVGLIVKGENVVSIRFVSRYAKDCQGLHYFVDNKDNCEYIYSQFQAEDAHKAFPCFDQPDLKARYTLLALVPKEWIAISTTGQLYETSYSGSPKFTG